MFMIGLCVHNKPSDFVARNSSSVASESRVAPGAPPQRTGKEANEFHGSGLRRRSPTKVPTGFPVSEEIRPVQAPKRELFAGREGANMVPERRYAAECFGAGTTGRIPTAADRPSWVGR